MNWVVSTGMRSWKEKIKCEKMGGESKQQEYIEVVKVGNNGAGWRGI